jgi:hypothetical protein
MDVIIIIMKQNQTQSSKKIFFYIKQHITTFKKTNKQTNVILLTSTHTIPTHPQTKQTDKI